ncbi:hypothetical protein BSKO_05727 [Bryopsis sp. KO-2023]|nr:hypothetical protein BSKO_05727 [Bryopsis sp. KO-2023]
MGDFSGVVKLANISDFIAPSQACVVNLDGTKKASDTDGQPPSASLEVQQHVRKKGGKKITQLAEEPVKVTLHDCLACSGCVTSAETVLLEHQGVEELLSKLADPDVIVAISVSPQTRASIAAGFNISPAKALRFLSGFLRSLGADYVFDLTTARDFSLVQSGREFVERYKKNKVSNSVEERRRSNQKTSTSMENCHGHFPMLASSCPGWICYAEKTHGDYILPYISGTRSPQATMGALLKQHFFRDVKDIPAERIYHCTLMPCYDKKLEASRPEFNFPESDTPEVDSSLTSIEIFELISKEGFDFANSVEAHVDCLDGKQDECSILYGFPGGSGGSAEFIYRYAAKELFGVEVPQGPLPVVTLRNADFKEIALEVDGSEGLRFALAYGFRNIQTLVRKVKRGISQYHYVEVMACPSGCLNGGGQGKPRKQQSALDLLKSVEEAYSHQDVVYRQPSENPIVRDFCSGPREEFRDSLFRATYQKREKLVSTTVGDW